MPEEKERTVSKVDYQTIGIEELVGIVKADVNNGLISAADIGKRVNNYGYNEIPEEKANPYISFAKKFWDPTAWMLEAVIVLSLILAITLSCTSSGGLLLLKTLYPVFSRNSGHRMPLTHSSRN